MAKDRLSRLIQEAKALNVKPLDLLQEESYEDGFILGFLHSKGITTVQQAIDYCAEHSLLYDIDILNHIVEDLFTESD